MAPLFLWVQNSLCSRYKERGQRTKERENRKEGRAEDRGQRSKVGDQKSEDRGPRLNPLR